MGFNPFRGGARDATPERKVRGADLALIVAALAIVVGLVLWAALPR